MKDKSTYLSNRMTTSELAELKLGHKTVLRLTEMLSSKSRYGSASQQERIDYQIGTAVAKSQAFVENPTDDDRAEYDYVNGTTNPIANATLTYDLTMRNKAVWAGRWAQCAFPSINLLDGRYAAALCATNVPPELVSFVRAPWRAFLIRLPADFDLPIKTLNQSDKRERGVTICAREYVFEGKLGWSYVLNGQGTMIDRFRIPTDEMCVDGDPDEFGCGWGDFTKQDQRSMHMAGKIIIGCCMAMQIDTDHRLLSQHPRSKKLRKCPYPTKLEYVVGRPVRVDARSYVTNYIESGRRRGPISTQHLTRGHWKWQPYGPHSTLRKFIHIEPYWAGPEDAPIVVRPHVLPGGNEERGAA